MIKNLGYCVLALCVVVMVGLATFAATNREHPQLYRGVSNHIREYGESKIALGQLVNFDWEQALFFDYTTPQLIYDAAGVNFGGTDLTRGLLFIQDGEIVYYEYFPQRAAGFDLRHVRIGMGGRASSLDIFAPDTMFLLCVGEDFLGNRMYWMAPYIYKGE